MHTANLDDLSSLLQNSTPPINIPGSQLSNSISGNFFHLHSLAIFQCWCTVNSVDGVGNSHHCCIHYTLYGIRTSYTYCYATSHSPMLMCSFFCPLFVHHRVYYVFCKSKRLQRKMIKNHGSQNYLHFCNSVESRPRVSYFSLIKLTIHIFILCRSLTRYFSSSEHSR